MALEVRTTYTSYWRATIKTLAAIGRAAPSKAAVAQSGRTSKSTVVVKKRAVGWSTSFMNVM
jgi:hypothetical protein